MEIWILRMYGKFVVGYQPILKHVLKNTNMSIDKLNKISSENHQLDTESGATFHDYWVQMYGDCTVRGGHPRCPLKKREMDNNMETPSSAHLVQTLDKTV